MNEINPPITFTIFTSKLDSSAILKEFNAPNYFPDKSRRCILKCHICPDKMLFLFNPLPDNKILDLSKLKQIEDDIFKFDENSRKFSKKMGRKHCG